MFVSLSKLLIQIFPDHRVWRLLPRHGSGKASVHCLCATRCSNNDHRGYIFVHDDLIVVQTVTSSFTSYTARRLHRQKHQIYRQEGFAIQSLTSLVQLAKQRTCEKLDTDNSDDTVQLPIHHVTERVMESMQQMHHHLQNFMMQKLGSDARNVIAAERARQASTMKQRQDGTTNEKASEEAYIARHLSEIGQEHGADELELLNEYRERYAAIMGELLVAKDKLLELEVGLRDHADDALREQLNEDLEELKDLHEVDNKRGRQGRRSSEW
jgi:hypothetical protein